MESRLIIHSNILSIINDPDVVYFTKDYLRHQKHQDFTCFEDNYFYFPFVTIDQEAISIPRSPFGSFFVKDSKYLDQFPTFLSSLKAHLRKSDVSAITIKHPSSIYEDFALQSVLEESGFEKQFADINQHIVLDKNWEKSIHEMQSRKLNALRNRGFEFKKMDNSELETAHKFISACRQVQGLTINITFDLLTQLNESTGAYDIFGVYREGKISALCITVRVTNKIAYYYLPATSPMFRSDSPMVLLIAGMVDYYQSQGFKIFDLGISSIDGNPQETLRIFKNRMGALETEKPMFKLSLS